MFIQHVSPPPPLSHVVSGWASASVMQDRHGGGSSQGLLSPKLQLCSDVFVHAFCLTAGTSLRPIPPSSPGF